MTSSISTFITSTLCDHGGSLKYKRLREAIANTFPGAVLDRALLLEDSKITIMPGSSKATPGQCLSPDSLLVAKTSLRICQKKFAECAQCDCLHLCRYYACGDCTFGFKCKSPHSLATPHNAQLLKSYGLQDLTEKQLFQLLLQNDPYLLPEICLHYNKGNSEHGSCKFSTSCTKLHVCQHYIQGDCKFGASCKRSHNINPQGMKMFHGFSKENIMNLPAIYRNKSIITSKPAPVVPASPTRNFPSQPTTSGVPESKPMTDSDKNKICLFFILRKCSFNEKCVYDHWHLPYRWQVLDTNGETWNDLPNMEEIEKAYCIPGNETSGTTQQSSLSGIFSLLRVQSPPVDGVDFMAMNIRGSPVRRLSTASSVSRPPHFILTTQWLWYWKDESGQWQEYGQDDAAGASVTSETLENVFLADKDVQIPFTADKHQYVLHFKGGAGFPQMYQENIKFKTKREVRRRPRFVSFQDVKMKIQSGSSHSSSSSSADTLPSYWDKNAQPDIGYKLVPLSKSAKDYEMIRMLFKRTMPLKEVKSIQRIQNPSLWKVFQWQKEQMAKRNNGKAVNQQYLFHGTDDSLIDAICEHNFDWRMCGVHGVTYGKGSYFARDASYSDRYVRATENTKTMFVALVLVGEYVRGTSSYVRPPAKVNGGNFYDSCVDREDDPGIFVIFEKQQIYPEYLIKYC